MQATCIARGHSLAGLIVAGLFVDGLAGRLVGPAGRLARSAGVAGATDRT